MGRRRLVFSTLAVLIGCSQTDPSLGKAPEHLVEIEYRQIMLGPTCMGNWRVKITTDGRVYSSRNTAHCKKGETWSSPWSPDPVTTLSSRKHRGLLASFEIDKLFALPPHITDPTKVTMGGYKEEIELTDGDRHHVVVAENVIQTQVVAVRKALRKFIL